MVKTIGEERRKKILKYPIVVSDNIIPLIYDREFKSFANGKEIQS